MLYHEESVSHVLSELSTSLRGLSQLDAKERLLEYGPNEIKVTDTPLWRRLVEPFKNVFMPVLAIAALISFLNGEVADGYLVLIIMVLTVVIYYVQQFSTSRVLNSLRKHDVQKNTVLRDGISVHLDSAQLVPGDIITLTEGEKVPADARLITIHNLRVNESALTGETTLVAKQTENLDRNLETFEQTNMLFAGSFIAAGETTAVVVRTGNDTAFGQLASLTANPETGSPVERKIERLLQVVILVIIVVALIAFGLSLLRGTGVTESLRFVIALAVSAVPESLPVAISIILVLGMRRITLKKALATDTSAIETIGVITTIATDKTGALTRNKLNVKELWQPEYVEENIVRSMALAVNVSTVKPRDPLDLALIDFIGREHEHVPKHAPLVSLPFELDVAMSGNLWHKGEGYELYVKGAPERILSHSTLTSGEHEEAIHMLHSLTAQGYHVVALANTYLPGEITQFSELPKSHPFTFVGFLALADVLRPESRRAIADAQAAGITVRMITGDHMETAFHLGKELGLAERRDQVFDSRKMRLMSDDDVRAIIDDVRIFARISPEHKYRILALLKEKNITAMTGDGVNDAPALVNAHVGIAMGSGSSVARDAGDIILLDDSFRSIISAMREGRIIIANIRRMLLYLLSTNAGEVLTALGALVIGMPVPLVAVQILWVNLVTDTPMVVPIGLEPGEKNVMTLRPKRPDAPILSIFMLSRIVLVALTMAGLTLALYAHFSHRYGEDYGRTIAFSVLVVTQWANALNARSDYQSLLGRLKTRNLPFAFGLTIAIILQALAIFGPLRGALHVAPIAIGDLYTTTLIAFCVPIIVVEIHKFIGRRYYHSPHLVK